MDQLIKGFSISFVGMFLVAILAVLSGTILFWVFPVVAAWLAANSINVVAPTWWQAVCFTWFLAVIGNQLFKSSTSVSTK